MLLHEEHARKAFLPGVPANYRNNPYRDPSIQLSVNGEIHSVTWQRLSPRQYRVNGTGVEVVSVTDDHIAILIDNVQRTYELKATADRQTFVWSSSGGAVLRKLPRYPRKPGAAGRETANSPMPGKVLRIVVDQGQAVAVGDPLVVLEAMKMEQTIRTTINGVVAAILVKPGQVVKPAQHLVEIKSQESA
jgi:propionyl-CoA carboxylase alpha chain